MKKLKKRPVFVETPEEPGARAGFQKKNAGKKKKGQPLRAGNAGWLDEAKKGPKAEKP